MDPTKTIKVPAAEVQPGQTVAGKYRIVRPLGRGGMGVVYEAEDLHLGRTVALKFLPAGLTADPEARERFIHEARTASSLDHPNICTIHDVDETEDGGLYIAMACYPGETLKAKIARDALAPADAVRIAAEVAEGLAKAHENGIVHRDVKPGNIMITPDGRAKILDFGLAKLAGEVRLTRPGTTVGTAAYMSPEQARGDEVDARTDLWSLGVILYEMTVGALPFGRASERAILHAIVHEEPRAAKELRAGFPAGIEGVIRKALAKDPGRRYASAGEMAADLRRLGEAMGGRAHPTAQRLSFRRSRPVWIAAGALSLAAIAAAVWLLGRPGLAFESRDKLLVADVENLTGDTVFDLALRTAIEADLQQSPFAAIYDRPQISDTLRLMRRDPQERIDENLGYDVCRFAGVRAFVLPRILSAGDVYELQAIVIDPVKRRHVDRIRVTARGREEVLLKGIDELTKRLRNRLGESLGAIEKADISAATVTTSSWEALDLFAKAQVKRNDSRFKEAAALYELALEKDPKFSAARSSLGLVLIQFLNEPERGKEYLKQALADAQSQSLPQRDVLSLKALNRQFVDGDLGGALEEYRLITEIYPDFMPAFNNSGRVLQALGRFDEAASMFEKAADLAPRSSVPLWNLWWLQSSTLKDNKAAETAARRLAELGPALANNQNILGWSLAAQGKFAEAEEHLRKAVEIEPDHPIAVANLAHVLFAAGKAAEAVPFYRRTVELTRQKRTGGTFDWDNISLALALKEAGLREDAGQAVAEGRAALEAEMKAVPAAAGHWLVLAALDAIEGRTEEARALIAKAVAAGLKDANDMMDAAEVLALLGQRDEALGWLKKSLQAGFSDYYFPVILPEMRALRDHPEFRALFKLGD
jgi:tetratricopeptide (TPR) repeat protein